MTKPRIVWEAQDEAVSQRLAQSTVDLKEIKEKAISTDPALPTNMLIEGDNLESLAALAATHAGQVDIIYIDPPYNRGKNDFVYNDRYVDENDQWRHSKWLSFMHRRLKLAAKLLKEQGVIFISIDDNEHACLRLLCDEVFGEDNFIGTFIRKENAKKQKLGKPNLKAEYEYCVAYSKSGNWRFRSVENEAYKEYIHRSMQLYKLLASHGISDPEAAFKRIMSGEFLDIGEGSGRVLKLASILFKLQGEHPELKEYVNVDPNGVYAAQQQGEAESPTDVRRYLETLSAAPAILTGFMGSDAKLLQGMGLEFEYPKRVDFIKFLLSLIDNKDALVLDFFAGSGTTGHAVLELNREDGGRRRFILCTNNEVGRSVEIRYLRERGFLRNTTYGRFIKTAMYERVVQTDEFRNLGIVRAVTYQRLKKAINGYKSTRGAEVRGLGGNLRYYEIILKNKE